MSSGFRPLGGGSGGGGGGATGLVEWGPEFGNESAEATAAIELRPYGWGFDLLQDRAAIDLVSLAIAGDAEARAKVELNFGFVMSQMIAQGAVDLSGLNLSTDLKPRTIVRGAGALALQQLQAQAGIGAAQRALLANLVPVVAADGSIVMSALNVNARGQIQHTVAPLFSAPAARAAAFLSRYDIALTVWANAVSVATGFSGTGANYVDKDVASFTTCSAASSGVGGITSNTVNGNLRVAHADWSAVFSAYTLDSVSWLHRFGAVTSGTILTAGSHSMVSYYSIDDGGAWTTQETFTTLTDPVNRNIDLTSIVDTWAKINGFRTRWEGSVTSGTGNGATRTFKAYYTALVVLAHQTF